MKQAKANQGYAYREQVGAAAGGVAVLDWVAARYPHSDRQTWAARIAAGEVTVDGAVARAATVLRPGQQLVWNRPPWEEPEVPLHFELLHEDEHLIAVAKPRGLPTQPAGGFLAHTLQTLVQRRWPEATPLHRLGRDTTGLVLFARTGLARTTLSRAFREGAVHKIYRTLASGDPPWDERSIEVPIGPVPHPKIGSVHAASPTGKSARSHARVIGRRGDAALLDVAIETGRPHQIRIHLAAVGHPLVGDPLYGPGGVPLPDALPGDGGYLLHAMEVGIDHPAGGRLTLRASLPPDLEA